MAKGAKSGTVKAGNGSTGSYPASQVVTLSNDSKYLFKMGQKANRRGSTVFDFYSAILSGTTTEINNVINQSQNNTYDYSSYDVTSYHGPLEAAVEAWNSAHPIGR